MPYKYHPPTRKNCDTCDKIQEHNLNPIISTSDGKASKGNNHPIHNWYNFVLGYTPNYPNYILDREKANKSFFIVDPFMGSGTTQVCCKNNGIPSSGIDANDFFHFVGKIKLNWDVDLIGLKKIADDIIDKIKREEDNFIWPESSKNQASLFPNKKATKNYIEAAKKGRPSMLVEKYISNAPLVKLNIVKSVIENYNWQNDAIRDIFLLAFAAIILPSSNVRYGPGFGVIKPREDVDVVQLFINKISRMIDDLTNINQNYKKVRSEAILGDARLMSKYYDKNSVDLMITSPPYPGDHEYTKHSRLELILMNYAQNIEQFRVIKKRMLRGSTTNIYKEDAAGEYVKEITSVIKIANEIEKRLKADGGTSGFEKLYSKLIKEYFGGMYVVFKEAFKVLKPGGKFALLVSDSHAFKMVHIKTAELLGEVAAKAGFVNIHVELWQYKNTTSHKYKLLENILTVEKPRQ